MHFPDVLFQNLGYLIDPSRKARRRFAAACVPLLDVVGGKNPYMGFTSCGQLW